MSEELRSAVPMFARMDTAEALLLRAELAEARIAAAIEFLDHQSWRPGNDILRDILEGEEFE